MNAVDLTKRERQLAALAAEGFSNKEIGLRLVLTEGTVKVYMSRLFTKLKIRNRLQLGLWAAGPGRASVFPENRETAGRSAKGV